MFDKKNIRQHFERAANTYDAAAVLQREVATRLTARLDYIRQQPVRALDVGCGTGFITEDLLSRYPKAEVLALDLSLNMLQQTRSHKQGRWKKWLLPARQSLLPLCADAEQLPLKPDSIDLLVSNLMLQWSNDLSQTLSGFHTVLAPNGLLLFSTFGTDTLKEMRQSWSQVDQQAHTSNFMDMHEIGDALLAAGFINPVTDREVITMTYRSVRQLMQDIKNIGASNSHSERHKGLMGKDRFKSFEHAYKQFITPEGLYPATWEIIYGHARVGEGLKVEGFDKIIPINPL